MSTLQKSYTENPSNKKKRIFIITLIISCLIILILALSFGSSKINLQELFDAIISNDSSNSNLIIIKNIRLPRVVGGFFAGAGLAVAGVILQKIMNNTLASPNTIGINSGAGFGAALAMALFANAYIYIPVFSFIFGLLAAMLAYLISHKAGNQKVTMILAGIAITTFFSALMKAIITIDPSLASDLNNFLIGTLNGLTFNKINIQIVIIIIGVILSFIFSRALDILSLGDTKAESLGLNVTLYRFSYLAIASLIASAVVSYAGVLAFVGLIVPHIVRMFVGQNSKILMISSAIFGGALLVLSDLLARVLFAPYEIPVGIIMACIGAPFFVYLLIKRGKSL